LWGGACLLAAPIAVILFFRARALADVVADALIPARAAQTARSQALRRGIGLLLITGAMAAFFLEIALLSGSIMPAQAWARGLVGLTLLATGAFGWRRFRRLGAESLQTLRNVLANDAEPDPREPAPTFPRIHSVRFVVEAEAVACGRSLRDLELRARSGASVIGIERQGVLRVNPDAETRLEAGDTLLLMGDDGQIQQARAVLTRG